MIRLVAVNRPVGFVVEKFDYAVGRADGMEDRIVSSVARRVDAEYLAGICSDRERSRPADGHIDRLPRHMKRIERWRVYDLEQIDHLLGGAF